MTYDNPHLGSPLARDGGMPDETRWQALEKLAVSDAGGDRLFKLITTALAIAFKVRWVGIGVRSQDNDEFVDIVSFMDSGSFTEPFSFGLAGTPCGELYANGLESCHLLIQRDVSKRFPRCTLLSDLGAVSYLGEVILDNRKVPSAHVLLMDERPMRLSYQEVEFFRLISHRAGAEFRRYRAEQRVQEIMEERERVLASICHDISQTPLAAQLLVMKLKEQSAEPDNRQILDQLSTTLSSMNALLEELRSHFAENANPFQTPVEFKPIVLSDMLRQLHSKFSPLAEDKGVGLRFVDTSLRVVSDAIALRTILGNLIANAVRYTIEGKILVGCRRRGQSIWIDVWDTGIGISSADLPNIFSSYFRGRNVFPASSEHPGYGLGLSIVKRKAEMIHGNIQVSSTLDKGTMFRVILPTNAGLRAVPEPVK